jgi:hypothetical protein
LVTLPAAGADGISGRFLYATALRTGLGSAPAFLDRGKVGRTRLIAFRRYGKKIAAVFENPRFRAANDGARPSPDFATSVVWMGDIAATLPDGQIVVDLSGFLTADTLGIAKSLDQNGNQIGGGDPVGAGKGFAFGHEVERGGSGLGESVSGQHGSGRGADLHHQDAGC